MAFLAVIAIICFIIIIVWFIIEMKNTDIDRSLPLESQVSSKLKIFTLSTLLYICVLFFFMSKNILISIIIYLCFGLLPTILLVREIKEVIESHNNKKKDDDK